MQTRSQITNVTPNSATNKRILSPESTPNSTTTKHNKKRKKYTMPSEEFNQLKDLINVLSSSIVNKIDESRAALENNFTTLDSKFTELASKVNSDVQAIKNTVTEFQNKIVTDIDSMNSTLQHHSVRLDNNEDDIQRVQLSQDVRLVGFAVKENENLVEIFRKIADNIGFAIGNNVGMPTVERMPTKNSATGQMMLSPTILIHFNSLRQKQLFYSLYLNKMPLKPENFGLTDDNRIVIGEHLTRKNAQLFKSAQTYRRNNKIAQTFTENGIVKIRFAKGKNEKTFTIRNQIELEATIAQYESSQSRLQPTNVASTPTPHNTTNVTQTQGSVTLTSTDGNSRQVSQAEAMATLQVMQQQQIQQQQMNASMMVR